MKIRTFTTIFTVISLLLPQVHAQTIGLATTKGGATAQISTAIAKVVSANSAVQLRPQAMANTQQYIPLVNAGKIELGLANVPQTRFATSGTGMSEGKPNPDLRMIVTLFTFKTGLMAGVDSNIKTIADMRGKKMPRFKDGALGDYIYKSYLEAGGLTYDDVTAVPASNFPTMWKLFKEGQTDTAIVAVGSIPAFDFQATFGEVNFVDVGKDAADIASSKLPGSFIIELNGSSPGEGDGRHAIAYDYALFAHKNVADDVITEVVGAIYDNPEALQETSPLWKDFTVSTMGKEVGVEYHPAAQSFYEEKGIWNQ